MHCHIGWHASLGFSLQFHERINDLFTPTNHAFPDMTRLQNTCTTWSNWASAHNICQNDSGI